MNRILGLVIELDDLEGVDPDLHRSLKWIMETTDDIEDVMPSTFSAEYERFGERVTVDFIDSTRRTQQTTGA